MGSKYAPQHFRLRPCTLSAAGVWSRADVDKILLWLCLIWPYLPFYLFVCLFVFNQSWHWSALASVLTSGSLYVLSHSFCNFSRPSKLSKMLFPQKGFCNPSIQSNQVPYHTAFLCFHGLLNLECLTIIGCYYIYFLGFLPCFLAAPPRI